MSLPLNFIVKFLIVSKKETIHDKTYSVSQEDYERFKRQAKFVGGREVDILEEND